ncbi:phosphotransferase [Dyadobacter arcticus]|uniref:5-methylthioribose kinase n=1 Tax=Dyadobacter arcticus TaxID=1078754 RepID=A0ABX0UNE3_9BACT|nr:phosphotransferase [Dyadobacter arcticus]NIJ54513.1 5-methylthioribose kinase [Dyadobacter arcticus]
MFILDANDITSLEIYLQRQEWLSSNEAISQVSVPGEGNMNYVLRITTRERSFVIKQSRGYVEKYPNVLAPAERVLMEGAFYQTTKVDPFIAKFTPELIGVDQVNNIMALEDLGEASDFMFLYNSFKVIEISQLTQLTDFLGSLHKNFYSLSPGENFSNSAMRSLNHEHIFLYPFMEKNGFDLDSVQPGLQAVAAIYKDDKELKNEVERLGQIYLSTGNCLLHGDFYPGSWLETMHGIKIIDPEFCFYGPAGFDLGVMIAHLHLAGQGKSLIDFTLDRYSSINQIDYATLNQFAGIEIIRRLIGLAQLPLQRTLQEKQELLRFARTLIMA